MLFRDSTGTVGYRVAMSRTALSGSAKQLDALQEFHRSSGTGAEHFGHAAVGALERA